MPRHAPSVGGWSRADPATLGVRFAGSPAAGRVAGAAAGGAAIEYELVEAWVRQGVQWMRLLVESLGALVIAVGIAVAVAGLARHFLFDRGGDFTPIRLAFARHLALALELQLAADILSTSVAPTWDQIGKLAAIAVIRTALNHFLSREIAHERAGDGSGAPGVGGGQGAGGVPGARGAPRA